MNRSNTYDTRPGNYDIDERHYVENEKKFSNTFLIILISLLFVAVFGGALVGGVVSGDPSNGFFITIIAASGVAIVVVILALIRYCIKQRTAAAHEPDNRMKESQSANLQPTFTRTADEDEEAGYDYDGRGQYIEEEVQTINALSMAPGDVSAMSPGTYDYDMESSFGQTASQFTGSEYQGRGRSSDAYEKQRYNGPFDFETVTSSQYERHERVYREDPPEEFDGGQSYGYSLSSVSRDPEAAVATADGKFIKEEDFEASPPVQQHTSKYAVEGDEDDEKTKEERRAMEEERQRKEIEEWERRTKASKSPKKKKTKTKASPRLPPPPPPSSTRSLHTKMPATKSGDPTSSEAGSAVSSMFLKPFSTMFGKKKAASEAGYNTNSSSLPGKVTEKKLPPIGKRVQRPPMPSKKIVERKVTSDLDTIGGNNKKVDDKIYTPASPGMNSNFSIPPPRHVPSTPGAGSQAPSEFHSVAASSVYSNGVASSTFDADAHERALRRNQQNAAALGASYGDMSIYYEDDESGVTSAAPRSVAPSQTTVQKSVDRVGYDVFAPSGPLGMVVDSIDSGCIVHSLKKNSPMQDLINPGDLIVALDDFDVRKMDAASLTKLMAKKSQQKERKFTLIPADQI